MYKNILILVFAGLCFVSTAQAASLNELGLDESTSYDIYLGGSSNGLPVLKGVQIIEMRTINNLVYLVVRTDAVFTKHADGLVRLDFVQAILPTFSAQPMQNSR